MNSLFFRLFGPFEVGRGDSDRVNLGPRKQRAVLALLALEPGRTVSLDRLIGELWADETPPNATGTLQAYISHLRRVLEPDRPPRTPAQVLLTREPGYSLAVPPGQVDLVRFTACADEGRRALAESQYGTVLKVLDRALALWRGEPLAEFAEYEFARPVIAQMHELRASATEDLFEARLAIGDSGSCVADLERLVDAYPYRERFWCLLVLALYRAGRQVDALAALRKVRGMLAAELGLEPGPELRRLERAVFDQSAALDAPSRQTIVVASAENPAVTPVTGVTDEPRQPSAQPLIAREAQFARICERLGEVRRGRGGAILVTGEAGIGKTRLAQAATEEAEALGIHVVWGRCVESEAAPAFWPWRQALRELGGETSDVAALLAGESADSAADPETALFELHARVLHALTGTGGPTFVVFDDLHAADAASLRLLAFVAGELHRKSVLVLATLRPEPGKDPEQLRDTLAELARQPRTERLTLPPFSAEDVLTFLRQHDLPDPALAARLHERTGGNPFFLGELLRLLGSEQRLDAASLGMPEGIREVIGRRVARLPSRTRDLLHSAAVLGREVSLDVLVALTRGSVEEVISSLEPAVATGLLVETPDGFDYRFSHALVRDALYNDLGRLRQARLHLRAGEALESLPRADDPSQLPIIAHHFARAARIGGAAKAVDYSVRAARQAAAQRAHDEAVALWDQALAALEPGDIARRCRLLISLGQALRVVCDMDRGQVVLDEAIELGSRLGDRKAVVEAVSIFGSLAIWNWRRYGVVEERIVALLEKLLEEPLGDAERATLLGTLAMEVYYGRRAEAERLTAEAVRIARQVGDAELLFQMLNNYALARWFPGGEKERRVTIDEMLGMPGLTPLMEAVALLVSMTVSLREGDLDRWEREHARAERVLREVRRPELHAMVHVGEAAYATLHGRWDEAERIADEAGGLLSTTTIWGADMQKWVTLFTSRRAQGRIPEIVDDLCARASDPDMVPLRPLAVLATVEVGDLALARELVGRWGSAVHDDWSADFLTVVWGHVGARLGLPDPAEVYDKIAPYADGLVVCGSGIACWGSTHMVLAELADAMGDRALARQHAERAHQTHLRLGLGYWSTVSERLLARLS
ncbi:BTAD domain-containing putative transcriptional regulator [Sphaerisporangium perillae]|uniref:BTAD domain-containing putative transcriptional regulator n=1 Tax=Sphaerisporangium perillae TaxID=2935860 RepID=UPI00200D571D|nr:BTAD domain-containing putative transcriptional regulator [Sphaerisporangium perillae]